jgi:putative spermidine/putrescine transport system permease protein
MSARSRLQLPGEAGWLSHCWSVVVALYVLVPVAMVVVMAFNDGQFLMFPPDGWSLRWFDSVLNARRWRNAFASTLQLAACSSIIATMLALSAALGLRRLDRPAFLQSVVMLPLIVPMIVTSFALVPFYDRLGLLGSTLGLVIVHALIALPFAFSAVWDSVRRLDPQLERAAQSLGASWTYSLRRVTLPLLRPAVVTALIVSSVISFDEVVATLYLAHPTNRTVPIEIWLGLSEDFSPRAAAASVLVMLLNLAVLGAGIGVNRCILARRKGPANQQ